MCYMCMKIENGDVVVLDQIDKNQARLYIIVNKSEVTHSYNGTSQ